MTNLKEQVEVLAKLVQAKRQNRLASYRPYPKQYQFHEAGVRFRERLLMAGNQVGKTWCASREVAMHATGLYPDWWPGRRFDRPVLIWTGSPTNETSKELIQKSLLGTSEPNTDGPDMGTGAIPRNCIVSVTTRQAGVKGVADEILVRHVSGRNSRIALKTYEQGRAKWQGAPVDVVWPDEEPDDPGLYSEAVTRTNQTGGIVMMTFTPLLGVTEVVDRFTNPDEGSVPRDVTNMTIYDCIGGTWEEGPWKGRKWEGHYTEEKVKKITASYADYEKDTRTLGIPAKGRGRVWRHSESEILCDPFPIPKHFSRIFGIDFGFDHPGALACIAHDRDTGIVYLYDSYKKTNETAAYHAAAIRSRDPENWIPVAWPHDGMNTEKGSGIRLHVQYRNHGVNMMRDSARYDDDIGGGQGWERFITDIEERIRTGRFKVFKGQDAFLEEFRNYHRDENMKVVPYKDDIISALKSATIELRHAKIKPEPMMRKPRYTRPIVGAR